MSRGRRRQRNQGRSEDFLLIKGMQASFIGVVLLVLSVVPSSNTMLQIMATAIRTPAWIVLGMGGALLLMHWLIAGLKTRTKDLPVIDESARPNRPAPAVQERREPVLGAPNPTPGMPSSVSAWGMDVLERIEWRRFEALIECLFAQAGFETRSQSHGADGGVDIWLHSKNAESPVAVVQCKHWQGKSVGVRELREFLGVMTAHGIKRGTYATSSTFTTDALAFAKANGINAQDGSGLLRMIQSRTPKQQDELMRVATEGEYWRPTCASCGVKMVERTPRKGGAAFWGCVNFPQCRATLPMRQRGG